MLTWTKAELEFIEKQTPIIGITSCAKALNRSISSVSHKAQRLGIKVNRLDYAKRSGITQMDNFDKSGKKISSPEAWKKRVKRLFNFTCNDCKLFCPNICVVHHIEEQNKAPHLKYEISNGVCLCPNCHAIRHYNIGRKWAGNRLSKSEKQNIRELYLAGFSTEKISAITGINHKTINTYK